MPKVLVTLDVIISGLFLGNFGLKSIAHHMMDMLTAEQTKAITRSGYRRDMLRRNVSELRGSSEYKVELLTSLVAPRSAPNIIRGLYRVFVFTGFLDTIAPQSRGSTS